MAIAWVCLGIPDFRIANPNLRRSKGVVVEPLVVWEIVEVARVDESLEAILVIIIILKTSRLHTKPIPVHALGLGVAIRRRRRGTRYRHAERGPPKRLDVWRGGWQDALREGELVHERRHPLASNPGRVDQETIDRWH